jgi:hypothetical protein
MLLKCPSLLTIPRQNFSCIIISRISFKFFKSVQVDHSNIHVFKWLEPSNFSFAEVIRPPSFHFYPFLHPLAPTVTSALRNHDFAPFPANVFAELNP